MESVFQSIAFFLGGIVVSGAAMLLRGDFLGRKAAEEVEIRMNDRINREMTMIHQDLRDIKDGMIRMEKRLDGDRS